MAHRPLRAGDLVTLDAKNATDSFVYGRNFTVDRTCATGYVPDRDVRGDWQGMAADAVPLDFIGIVVGKHRARDPLLDRQIELIGVLVKDDLLYFARADLRRLYAISWAL